MVLLDKKFVRNLPAMLLYIGTKNAMNVTVDVN